jgi:hypothetical protein
MVVWLRQLAREEGIEETLEFLVETSDPLHPLPRLADRFFAAAHAKRLDEMRSVRARLHTAYAVIDPKDDRDTMNTAIASAEEFLRDVRRNERLVHRQRRSRHPSAPAGPAR